MAKDKKPFQTGHQKPPDVTPPARPRALDWDEPADPPTPEFKIEGDAVTLDSEIGKVEIPLSKVAKSWAAPVKVYGPCPVCGAVWDGKRCAVDGHAVKP